MGLIPPASPFELQPDMLEKKVRTCRMNLFFSPGAHFSDEPIFEKGG